MQAVAKPQSRGGLTVLQGKSRTHLLALVQQLLVRRAVLDVVVAEPGVEGGHRLDGQKVAEVGPCGEALGVGGKV